MESSTDLGRLFQKLFHDFSRLIQSEVQLLKVELEEDLSELIKGSLLLVIGLLVGIFAFGILTVTILLLLDVILNSLIWSSLTTGLAYLILCVILISIGKSRAQQALPILEESIEELQKDKDII
jgi:uncharacterized membrane protein YqjE